jgi:aminotransferase EvaB
VTSSPSVEGAVKVPFNDLSRDDGTSAVAVDAALRVLESGYYLMGPNVAAFEHDFSQRLGGIGVVAVGSGTDALALSLQAFQLRTGAEVLVPANAGGYASIAAGMAGLRPISVDVDADTLLVSRESLERAAGVDCRAVIATHLYGQVVSDIVEIRTWCDLTGRVLIEDCAQASGASVGGQPVGTFGHAAAFSFYPTKNLGAMGDAGAITSADPTLVERLRVLAQYGWTPRYHSALRGGRNSRMDEVQAAVLRVRLPELNKLNSRRKRIHDTYATALNHDSLRLVGAGSTANVGHLAVLVCDDRTRAIRHLQARGISTAIHYPFPDHRQPGLAAEVGLGGAPVAEDACERVLSVPCFPALTDSEVSQVADALRSYV